MQTATRGGQIVSFEINSQFAITASDTVNISVVGARIHVNKTGTYNLLLSGDELPQKLFLIAGVTYPFRVMRLFVTDTDVAVTDGLIGLDSVYTVNDRA